MDPKPHRLASLSSAISELDPSSLRSLIRRSASLPALPQQGLDPCLASSTVCHDVDTSHNLLTVLSILGDIYISALAKRLAASMQILAEFLVKSAQHLILSYDIRMDSRPRVS